MEFPDLGKNCSNSDCKQLDFLPVVCDACNKVFCLSHYQYEAHSCSASFQRDNQVPVCPLCNQPVPLRKGESPDVRVNAHIEDDCQDGRAVKKRSIIYKNRCSFEKCKKRELVPITCDTCRKNFCLKHRNPLDHTCITVKRGTTRPNGSINSGNRDNNSWSLSRSGEAALRRLQATTSSVAASVTNIANRTSDSMRKSQPPLQSSSTSKVKSVQGNLTEDEALAWAMQQSLNEQSSKAALGTSSTSQSSGTSERNQRDFDHSKDKCDLM